MLSVKIIKRLIDSLYHCCFLIEVKRGVKTADYVWLWWFSSYMRQIGEPSGQQLWQQQTSVINELDGEKKDNHISATSLAHIWRDCSTFCQMYFTRFSWKWRWKEPPTRPRAHPILNNIFSRLSAFHRPTSRSARFTFKVAIISHLCWHLQSDEGEVKSLRWLIIISKVPCHAADLNKRVWSRICMHLYAWAKRLIS